MSGGTHHTLNLRPRFNTHRIIALLSVAGVVGGVSLGAFFAGKSYTEATSADLYPQHCSGTWQFSWKAEGIPDLADSADVSTIDIASSSVLSLSSAELICADFVGKVPPDMQAKNATLRIAMRVDVDAPGDTLIGSPSSALESVSSASTTDVSSINDISTSTDPELSISQATTTSEQSTTTQVTTNVSENNSSTIPMTVEGSSTTDSNAYETNSPATSSSGVIADVLSFLNPARVWRLAANVIDSVSIEAPKPIVEVSYTFGDGNWQTVGAVSQDNWRNAVFDIPVQGIQNLNVLAGLQIKISAAKDFDQAAHVYVDGMRLSIVHEEKSPELEEEPPVAKAIDTYSIDGSIGFSVRSALVGGDVLTLSEMKPRSYVAIYRLDDGSTPSGTSYLYGSQVGDNGKVEIPADTLDFGRQLLINTSDPRACASMEIDECRAQKSGVGEATVGVIIKSSFIANASEVHTPSSVSATSSEVTEEDPILETLIISSTTPTTSIGSEDGSSSTTESVFNTLR